MTDAQEALRQVSEALNKANDASETIGESTWYRKAELRAVCGDAMLDGDRDFIAACSPTNMSAILAHVEAQAAEIERLRAVVSALAFQANRDPFTTIGHWCEHGPCAAIIRDVSNPYADHHGPDWTQRDSEYLK